jgi:hypothetical protein
VKKQKRVALDFEVDRLTNSIQNTISGDSFPTEVSRLINETLNRLLRKRGGHLIGNVNLTTMQTKFIS